MNILTIDTEQRSPLSFIDNDGVLKDIRRCLMGEDIPEMNQDCDYCSYRKELAKTESWAK